MFLVPRTFNTFNNSFFNDEHCIEFMPMNRRSFNNYCPSYRRPVRQLRQPKINNFFNNTMDDFAMEIFNEPFFKPTYKTENNKRKAPKRHPENNKSVSNFFEDLVPFANEDPFFNFDRHFEDNFFNIRPRNLEKKINQNTETVKNQDTQMDIESPKIYKKTFESSYVNNNGNKSEIIRKTKQNHNEPKETFVTKITQDVNGEKKVVHLNPEKFNLGELEPLADDQVLRAVEDNKVEDNQNEMLEENKPNMTFEEFQKSSDKKSESGLSNEGKNKMFESVQF